MRQRQQQATVAGKPRRLPRAIAVAVAVPGPLQASQRCTVACEPGAAETRRQRRRFPPRAKRVMPPPPPPPLGLLTWQDLSLPSAGPLKQPVDDQRRKPRLQNHAIWGCWHTIRTDGRRVVGGGGRRARARRSGDRGGIAAGRGLNADRKGVWHYLQCSSTHSEGVLLSHQGPAGLWAAASKPRRRRRHYSRRATLLPNQYCHYGLWQT